MPIADEDCELDLRMTGRSRRSWSGVLWSRRRAGQPRCPGRGIVLRCRGSGLRATMEVLCTENLGAALKEKNRRVNVPYLQGPCG